MNTNNNVYTIFYTTLIVVVVAALLAFVSQSLKVRQEANEKADAISQMMTAACYGTRAHFQGMGNAAVLDAYAGEIGEAFTVNPQGDRVRDLETDRARLEVYSPKQLKQQNYNIKGGIGSTGEAEIPVFVFRNGMTVVPIYGAGLWGPIWGYLSFKEDGATLGGGYFDHESETAGLGARIKDDPTFQAEFSGETVQFSTGSLVGIVKGGSPKDAAGNEIRDGKVDAISGATMTSKGLEAAIDTWLAAYAPYFTRIAAEKDTCLTHSLPVSQGEETEETPGETQVENPTETK